MGVKVFVYGTLRTGDRRFGVESFVKMIAPVAYIHGFEMLDLGAFPGLVKPAEDAADLPRIRGEVHEYEHLDVLDQIEGYSEISPENGLYNRVQVAVETPEGEINGVWVYILNTKSRRTGMRGYVVQSGDWFEHQGRYKGPGIESGV